MYQQVRDDLPEDLLAESEQQRNCAAIRAFAVADGMEYLYRVLRPVRATLSVLSDRREGWTPGELMGFRNEPVDEKIRRQLFGDLFASRG